MSKVKSAGFSCIQLDMYVNSRPAGTCLWRPAGWSADRTWQRVVSTLHSTSSHFVLCTTHK